jgi:hypothetical protein
MDTLWIGKFKPGTRELALKYPVSWSRNVQASFLSPLNGWGRLPMSWSSALAAGGFPAAGAAGAVGAGPPPGPSGPPGPPGFPEPPGVCRIIVCKRCWMYCGVDMAGVSAIVGAFAGGVPGQTVVVVAAVVVVVVAILVGACCCSWHKVGMLEHCVFGSSSSLGSP